MKDRRVVVTGLGLVSSLGLDVQSSWDNILAGKSGVRRISRFDPSELSCQIAAEVDGFDPTQFVPSKDIKKMAPFTQFAMAACEEALNDAGITTDKIDPTRAGVAVGSGIGGIEVITDNYAQMVNKSPRRISPFFIPASIINIVSGQLSIKHGFKGPNIAIVTACTTGTHNIGHAARMIQYGDADVMITGGTEMATSALTVGGFAACRALTKRNDDPEHASRPWDKNRDGFILGEGAGILILESYEHAKARGADIYCEISGFGMSGDAYHITSPDPTGQGAISAMQNALNDAALNTDQIQYINAHATSTPAGDELEALAIRNLFSERAKTLPVSSTKSMIGHLLGAAGAVEAIFSVLALRDNVAPPTINLDNPDEDYEMNLVAHTAQEHDIKHVLSNSFGFGGTNGALIFSQY